MNKKPFALVIYSEEIFESVLKPILYVGIICVVCVLIAIVFFGPASEADLLFWVSVIISTIVGIISGLEFIKFHRFGWLSSIVGSIKYDGFSYVSIFVTFALLILNSLIHGVYLLKNTINLNGIAILIAIWVIVFVLLLIYEIQMDNDLKRTKQQDLRIGFSGEIMVSAIMATLATIVATVSFCLIVGFFKSIALFDRQGFFYVLVITVVFQIIAVIRTKESKTHFID